MPAPSAVYRPRHPQDSDYYRCVEDYFETFLSIYDEYFSRQYGFWRPYVEQVIGELSGSQSGWRVYSPSPRANGSNDLFGRANQRAVGLIGRVAPRNSPYGRAQRGRTIVISIAVICTTGLPA